MSSATILTKSSQASDREALAFILGMKLNRVSLPLRHDRRNCGTILDAEGNGIIVVDVNRERPDDQVMAIAELIVIAINARAGLAPEGI